MFDLQEYRITFGVDCDRHDEPLFDGHPVVFADALGRVCKNAAIEFGGYSLIGHRGGWVNDAGHLVTESARTIVVYAKDGWTTDTDAQVEQFAQYVGRTFDQDSVCLAKGDKACILKVNY